jgi:hypothetical protein
MTRDAVARTAASRLHVDIEETYRANVVGAGLFAGRPVEHTIEATMRSEVEIAAPV